jgi:hypothetical protein
MALSEFDIDSLTIDEQLSLIDRLWERVERAAADGDQRAVVALGALPEVVTPELLDELRRRIDEHERDPGTAVPWETLNEELKRRFG